jgi:hypothetical protein
MSQSLAARVTAERADQGLPDHIQDEHILARVTALLVTDQEDDDAFACGKRCAPDDG